MGLSFGEDPPLPELGPATVKDDLTTGRPDAMRPDVKNVPFGLRVLQWCSLVVGAWALLDLVSAVWPSYLSSYAFPETRGQRAVSIIIGLLFAPLFYGIPRRLTATWKYGWLILAASFSWVIVEAIISIERTPQSGGWINSALIALMFSVVAIYWGRWWYRQRTYFSQHRL